MRQDKKDVSKIEEIEENRQTYVTNVVHHRKEDHFEGPKTRQCQCDTTGKGKGAIALS